MTCDIEDDLPDRFEFIFHQLTDVTLLIWEYIYLEDQNIVLWQKSLHLALYLARIDMR